MQFIFRAVGRFDGIDVFIDAETLDEAQEKAKAHDYEMYDAAAAECIDLDIDIASGTPNE